MSNHRCLEQASYLQVDTGQNTSEQAKKKGGGVMVEQVKYLADVRHGRAEVGVGPPRRAPGVAVLAQRQPVEATAERRSPEAAAAIHMNVVGGSGGVLELQVSKRNGAASCAAARVCRRIEGTCRR